MVVDDVMLSLGDVVRAVAGCIRSHGDIAVPLCGIRWASTEYDGRKGSFDSCA